MLMLNFFYFSFYFECLCKFNKFIMIHLSINNFITYQLPVISVDVSDISYNSFDKNLSSAHTLYSSFSFHSSNWAFYNSGSIYLALGGIYKQK